jgi:hypothetical protein
LTPIVSPRARAAACPATPHYFALFACTSPTILAPWLALALLVAGFASTFVLRARRSASAELKDLSAKTSV